MQPEGPRLHAKVIKRKLSEGVDIGTDNGTAFVTVQEIHAHEVTLVVRAPLDVSVSRSEVPEAERRPRPLLSLPPKSQEREISAINVGGLDPTVFEALKQLAVRKRWTPVRQWMAPSDVLILLERLERTIDSIEAFPNGKYPTIQRLRDIFRGGFTG